MIVTRHEPDAVLQRLRAKINGGTSAFIGACGTGLVAKLLERSGADFVCTFSGARLRGNGVGTMAMWWPILDSNQQLLDYTERDILPALQGDACVLACVQANDPTRDMRTYLQKLKDIGVVAISHAPSIGYFEKDSLMYNVLTQSGITFEREIEMLQLAKDMGFITCAQPFNLEDTQRLVKEAKPHMLMYHAGTTHGGLVGFQAEDSIADTTQRSQKAFRLALDIDPDIILFGHGGALVTADDGQYMLDNSDCHGVWTGSATERIPIERAVGEAASAFASLQYRPR